MSRLDDGTSRAVVLERKLAQALRHTQTVLDASPVGIITYAANGQGISANPAAAAIVGTTVEALRAQNLHQIPSWRASGLYAAATTALATGLDQRVETPVETSYGRSTCLNAHFLPFEFEGERQLMLIVSDTSERKRLEAQFLQAQKMEAIGRLAGGIAHDFNNILAVIMSFGEFARDGLPETDERHDDIQEVLKAASRAASLTQQLLIFSRQQPTKKRAVDLNQNLSQIARFLTRAVGEDVHVAVEASTSPVVVMIDPVQFDQILLNLAVNARDAMPRGGQLRIVLTCGDAGATAHLTVTDTGCGMDEATRARIFEPFFTTKERSKGTGLGLATCFGIVAEAGGTIAVKSAVGVGTAFTIQLPICFDAVDADDAVHDAPPRGQGEVVLVVEDDAAVRRATLRTLELAGYEVFAAADGEEAIRKIGELGAALRLVLSDVVMPGCSGNDVARHLARVSPATPIILTSGFLDDSNRRARVVGEVPMLWKPVRRNDLLVAVAAALARAAAAAAPSHALALRDRASERDLVVARPSAQPPRERVLLIEDDAIVASATRRGLEQTGFEIVVAGTLCAARAELAAHAIDVLILDIGLPDGSGLDLLRELRDNKVDLPVLMLTGSSSVESAAAAVRGRIREYLQKPVAIAELRRAVRAAADGARMTRLRSKLLAARFGNEELLRDLPRTERQFGAALASLEMVYQPIVRAGTGSIFAYEALVRTGEPAFAGPAQLLSAAEALGRVDDLGRAVRAAVAAALVQHPERGEPIFVNVHPTELRRELFGDPRDPLLRFAHRIVFEVTEDGACETGPRLETTLAHLRSLGYRLAIDDLGQGYAGLSSLVDLRPEFAKIDMSLVRNVHLDPFKRDIVGSVVDLARRSRISIIAEGVETPEERDALVELGCDLLQGFWFARPAAPFARFPTTPLRVVSEARGPR